MATRFGVSLRTIYRDMRTLEEAGVPICGEAGAGYSIVEGYRLPPVMFTREEASSFVAAEKLMQKFTDTNLRGHYASAMYKVKSILKGADKALITALESNIDIRSHHRPFNAAVPNALELLLRGIGEQLCLRLHYKSIDAKSAQARVVEPIGIFHENGFWYLLAWCQLRADYRHFRADRIQQIAIEASDFSRKHASMTELRKREASCTSPERVVIRIDKSIVRYMASAKYYFGFESEEDKGDMVEMTFMVDDAEEGFPRWLISYGDHCHIISPETLKERVAEIAKGVSSRLLRS